MSFNKVHLLGNLGKDPESKTTTDGTEISKFSMATTEKVKGADRVEWHNVTVFGKAASFCNQYLTKGSKVFVEGKLTNNSWDDKKTGEKRYSTSILASSVQALDSKKDREQSQPSFNTDEVPF